MGQFYKGCIMTEHFKGIRSTAADGQPGSGGVT